jgi:hypothetical protein
MYFQSFDACLPMPIYHNNRENFTMYFQSPDACFPPLGMLQLSMMQNHLQNIDLG